MQRIVDVHFPGIKQELLAAALKSFYDVRNLPGLKKKPSTSELIDWLKLLLAEDIPASALHAKDEKVSIPPLVGALLKNEQDVSLFEKLIFMQRQQSLKAARRLIAVEPVTLADEARPPRPAPRSHHADALRAAAADGELGKLRVTSVPEPDDTRAGLERRCRAGARAIGSAFAVVDLARRAASSATTQLPRHRAGDRPPRDRLHVVREERAAHARQHRPPSSCC